MCNTGKWKEDGRVRIISDSSANLDRLEGTDFISVPLTVRIGEKTYMDTPALRVRELLREMDAAAGPTGTACPSVGDWLDAFGDQERIFVATLTGTLSGCYGSAVIAAKEYMEEHPGRRVDVLNSLTTGPELELILEQYAALIRSGTPFVRAGDGIRAYRRRTHLAFMLSSLDNFARNGRVSPALAKLVSMLHIHIVGRASAGGELEPLNRCRGRNGALQQLWKNMKAAGYDGGKVRIRHTENAVAASELRRNILTEFPGADVRVGENRGLCSYYAEHGGILVGYEGGLLPVESERKRERR